MKIITNNEKETIELGEFLAKKCKGGEVFALSGDLGSGKTVLAKGMAKGLGVKAYVTSPTFVLMKIYGTGKGRKIKEFVHVDCYRLGHEQDLIDIGITEYLNRPDAVCLIEWAEKLPFLKKYDVSRIVFRRLSGKDKRSISY